MPDLENFPWVSIVGGLVSTFVGAVVTLAAVWGRLKKVDGEEETRKTRLDIEKKEHLAKLASDDHEKVVAQLLKIIDGYESRFTEVTRSFSEREYQWVKQSQERELQFQSMIKEREDSLAGAVTSLRTEHLECNRKLAAAEARIQNLETQLEELKSSIARRHGR